MNPDIKKYLEDIKLSIEAIEFHVQQINDLEDYQNNLTVLDAVERRLAIIGEALYKINKTDKEINISNKAKIIGLRHILIHEYDLIEDATIWNIVHNNLSVLKQEVIALINV
ncbi:MAG TPA: DUF86 domain-containing protein [Chitinophagaceae bacterium]|nr:DUF86 domain-containing protein [Chitinophagaceae bacterium]